jgi:hypothetical protein
MIFFSGCFVLLQGVDFSLTWALLESGVRTDVYEANPLANAILARKGWLGLAGFKLVCTGVALGAGVAASIRRPAVGLRLMALEVLAMAGVVGYSALLVHGGTPAKTIDDLPALESRSNEISGCLTEMRRFDYIRGVICRRVLQGEEGFVAGVERLRGCIASYAPRLSKSQRERLPDTRNLDQVAAYMYHHSSRLSDDDAVSRAGLERLAREVARHYPEAPRIKLSDLQRGGSPTWSSLTAY